jgi:hypothetical protein
MPMNNPDRDWVNEKINTAIQSQVAPQGWRRLREHLPLAGMYGIFVALLALAAAAWYFAFTKIEARATFEANTGSTLASIDKRLGAIESSLAVLQARFVSQKLANVPPGDLKIHREELSVVRSSLAKSKDEVPGFWPSSFEIITLLSKASSSTVDLAKLQNAPESVYSAVTADRLGAIAPIERVRAVLKNHVQGMIFRDSIIRFDPSVTLSNDIFVNCVFIFPPEQNPTGPLQQIGRTLLASNIENVTLNAS